MRLLKTLVASAALIGAAGTANAVPATWVDHIDFNPNVYVGFWDSYSYTHNVVDEGFTPFTDDIYSYDLSLNLFDDGDRGDELVKIDVLGLTGDTYALDLSGTEFGGWSLLGHIQLLLTGTYSVSIESYWGDFYLGDSTLTVWGEELGGDSVSVPEPATLGLLSLALLGFGAVSRKRNKV